MGNKQGRQSQITDQYHKESVESSWQRRASTRHSVSSRGGGGGGGGGGDGNGRSSRNGSVVVGSKRGSVATHPPVTVGVGVGVGEKDGHNNTSPSSSRSSSPVPPAPVNGSPPNSPSRHSSGTRGSKRLGADTQTGVASGSSRRGVPPPAAAAAAVPPPPPDAPPPEVFLTAHEPWTARTDKELTLGRDEVVLLIKNDPTKKWWLVENQSGQRGFAPITHLITMDGSPAASSVKLNRSASGSRLQRRSSSTSLGAYPVSIAPNAMGPQYSGAWPAAMMQRRMSGRMPPPPFISERAAEAARRDHEAQMMAMQLQAQQNALVAQQQQIALQQQQLELAKAQQGMYSAYQGAQKVAAEVNTAVSGQARVNAIEE